MLSQHNGGDGHLIAIGGWTNTQSVIRDKKQKPHPGYAVTKTSNYLSSSYYREFWINLKRDGTVILGTLLIIFYFLIAVKLSLSISQSLNLYLSLRDKDRAETIITCHTTVNFLRT